MAGELDFFDTQVSAETLGADKDGEKKKGKIRLFQCVCR